MIFEIGSHQKQVTTLENGLIGNINLVFEYIEGVRTKLKAWVKGAENQVSEYDVIPQNHENVLKDSIERRLHGEFQSKKEALMRGFDNKETSYGNTIDEMAEKIKRLEGRLQIGEPELKQLVQQPEEELSRENAEFLADPKRKAEYIARKARLKNKEQAAGMPTFEECIEAMKKKGNKVLNTLRAKTQDPRLTIAVIVGKDGKVKSFRPGLIEAYPSPHFLRDRANTENNAGKHYDKVYADLSPHGLREPDFDEYRAVFETVQAMGDGLIDTKYMYTMLDMGERKDKGVAVPLAAEAFGGPGILLLYPPHVGASLVSRPSTWGDDMLHATGGECAPMNPWSEGLVRRGKRGVSVYSPIKHSTFSSSEFTDLMWIFGHVRGKIGIQTHMEFHGFYSRFNQRKYANKYSKNNGSGKNSAGKICNVW
ncbi:MAG: hypothetical protein WC843_04350 [Candidatus Gracilibacteria bacterium]